MKTVTVNVLASDFENNYHMNLEGCPVILALKRVGIDSEKGYNYLSVSDADFKVCQMFTGKIPIEDFSFQIELQ